MDYTTLFSLLSTANKHKDLIETIDLSWFSTQGKPVRKTKKKLVEEKIVGVVLPLESDENEAIYITSPIQEFFLAHSILVGEDSQIQKGKLFSGTTLYFEKKYFERFKQKIIHSSLEMVHPKELFNKKIQWNFKKSPLHKELNEYVLKNKHLVLNAIHVQKGSKVELFVPNLKKKHFNIAKKMHIPLISLLEKGFLRDTTINIFDINRLEQDLLPHDTTTITTKKNVTSQDELIYRDIEKKLELQLQSKDIIEVLENKESKNFSKEIIIDELLKHKKIQIGNQYEKNIHLPLWKTNLGYKTFSNPQEFEEYLGVSYEYKNTSINSLYLIDKTGKPCEFLNYYLPTQLNHLFEEQQKDSLKFKNTTELLLLLYLDSKGKVSFYTPSIIEISHLKQNYIDEIKHIVHKITTTLFHTTLSKNKLPNPVKPQLPLEFVISHAVQELNLIRNTYVESAKEEMIKQTLFELKKIATHYSKKTIDTCDFFFLELIKEVTKTLQFLDEDVKNITSIIEEYYKDVRSTYHVALEKNKLEDYKLYLLAQKLKKKDIYLFVKNLSATEISFDVPQLNKEDAIDHFKKLHKDKLQLAFPKSYPHLIEFYEKHNTLPQEFKKNQLTLHIEKEKFLEELPVFKNLSIKGISPSYIIYSK